MTFKKRYNLLKKQFVSDATAIAVEAAEEVQKTIGNSYLLLGRIACEATCTAPHHYVGSDHGLLLKLGRINVASVEAVVRSYLRQIDFDTDIKYFWDRIGEKACETKAGLITSFYLDSEELEQKIAKFRERSAPKP